MDKVIKEKELSKQKVLKAVATLMEKGFKMVSFKDLEHVDMGKGKLRVICKTLFDEGKLQNLGYFGKQCEIRMMITPKEISPHTITVGRVIQNAINKMTKEKFPQLKKLMPRFQHVISTKGKVRLQEFTVNDVKSIVSDLMTKYSFCYVHNFILILRGIFNQEVLKKRIKENVFYNPGIITLMTQLRQVPLAKTSLGFTVEDMMSLAISTFKEEMTPRSAETYIGIIKKFAKHIGPQNPIKEATSEAVVVFLENHRVDHMTKTTLLAISAINRMFEITIKKGELLKENNPMKNGDVRKTIKSLNVERMSKIWKQNQPRPFLHLDTEETVPDAVEAAIMEAAPVGFWGKVKQFFSQTGERYASIVGSILKA